MLPVLFIVFLVLVALNLPIAFAMLVASLAALLVGDLPLAMVTTRLFVQVDSFSLMAIPFFIFAGDIMNSGGITKRIVALAQTLVGHIKGGLAHVNIVSSIFFAGISGSATADTSALGSMLIPIMEEDGYPPEFCVAVTAASSTIGPIIPPSIMMVMYAVIASESVAMLFIGGLVPGILIGLTQMFMAYKISKKHGYGSQGKFSFGAFVNAFKSSILAIIMPLIILGGILSGIFTATEAGVIACVYAIIVGVFVYKEVTFKELPVIFYKSAKITAQAMFIVASAAMFSWILAWTGFPSMVLELLLSISTNPTVVLLLIIGFILVLGLFVEGTPVLIIFAPVFVPVVQSLGISLVLFGVLFVMSVLVGSITPPVGVLLYLGSSIAGIPVAKASKAIWPFVLTIVVVILLCVFVPQVITFLPELLYG
ncbi:TRAP transporter large permease [Chakrabartyella piscis]|uniref:TRAP transporter large permease n=1 Tax=Chakrabartyella piscis TaxID=2918914 RepID=UPI0029589490|nr:TRAP transporter large permease [Chakrabartyella piscis]